MRQVTREEFYAVIGPLNVETTTRSNYNDDDYGTDFNLKDRNRTLVGKTVKGPVGQPWKPETSYFLPVKP